MTFDPKQHLIQLKGKDYLEVKWRLVWINETVEDFSIDTDVIELNERRCVCRAGVTVTVSDGDGNRHVRYGCGVGSETPGDFADYIEKAQTKAIGRALALVGFGTQFADADGFDSEAAANRPVDAPVQRPHARPPVSEQATYHPPAQSNGDAPVRVPGGATTKQVWLVRKLASEKGVNPEEFAKANVGTDDLNQLTGGREGTASYLIDKLQKMTIEQVPF